MLPRARYTGPALVAGAVAVLLVWGAAVEPRFLLEVKETEAAVPALPEDWDGGRVALIGDLQIGMWLDNPGMSRRVVREILRARPDLVLIAGDFVHRPDSSFVRQAVELVRPLGASTIPAYAVLGNHDYGMASPDGERNYRMARYLETQLEAAGITVLQNESVALRAGRAGGGRLHLAGIGSAWADRARPADALSGVPRDAPRIVVAHNPLVFRELPPYSAPVVLTAHTHGGQIRLPFLESESWLDIARPREVIADGWSVDSVGAPGNRAYVNRGLGFSAAPLRILCRPELTLITLRSGNPSPERSGGRRPALSGGSNGRGPGSRRPPETPSWPVHNDRLSDGGQVRN